MADDFDKHRLADLGQKLAHLEGVLGAYLPQQTFSSELQKQALDVDKFQFSRLRSGVQKVANWQLGVFVEMFDLNCYGLDYRLFLEDFNGFDRLLKEQGVGCYGASVAGRLRERLRAKADMRVPIQIRRDRLLNVGGIGGETPAPGLVQLTSRDRVSLIVTPQRPVKDAGHFLLLHDFPRARAMSCLMPSLYAPDPLSGDGPFRLPQPTGYGDLTFPVAGDPGYRCLYGVQTATNLAAYIGLKNSADDVVDLTPPQITLLVDFLSHAAPDGSDAVHVCFGEYLMK